VREIEFRVWSNELNQYLKSDNLYFVYDGGIIKNVQMCLQTITCPLTDYVMEQYTGLKDKNGIDIYDGDRVRQAKGNLIAEIKYHIGASSGFVAEIISPQDYKGQNVVRIAEMPEQIEVIGNIHDTQIK
jgi:uncharacterized phage protein (TIGR01671 family)